jgi:hypothetical protein
MFKNLTAAVLSLSILAGCATLHNPKESLDDLVQFSSQEGCLIVNQEDNYVEFELYYAKDNENINFVSKYQITNRLESPPGTRKFNIKFLGITTPRAIPDNLDELTRLATEKEQIVFDDSNNLYEIVSNNGEFIARYQMIEMSGYTTLNHKVYASIFLGSFSKDDNGEYKFIPSGNPVEEFSVTLKEPKGII